MAQVHDDDPELACIDKNKLYGKYEAGKERKRERMEWREKLAREAASKSLDIALDDEDDMDITTTKTINNNGVGLKGLALMGLMMAGTGVGGAGLTAYMLNKDEPAPVVQQPTQDNDTQFRLEFTEPKE